MQHIIIALLCFAGDYIWPAYYQWPAYELQPITVDVAKDPEPPAQPEPSPLAPTQPPEPVKVVKPTLDFYTAKWCGPCRVAKPLLATAKQAGLLPFDIHEVDVDQNPGQWNGSLPAFVWSVKKSKTNPTGRVALVGWYGVDHLVSEFQRTRTTK